MSELPEPIDTSLYRVRARFPATQKRNHGTGWSPNRATQQPNILILWGDDVGYWNISRNRDGMMGYRAVLSSDIPHFRCSFRQNLATNRLGFHANASCTC